MFDFLLNGVAASFGASLITAIVAFLSGLFGLGS